MRYWQCLSVMLVAAGVSLAATPAAQAKCGCIAKLKTCFSQITSDTFDADARACFDGFDACVEQCKDKQMCRQECRAFKHAAIAACKETFAETQCASGPTQADCRRERRKAVHACVLEAHKDQRACKTSCKP